MRFAAAASLLFASLALASPAPVAQPDAAAVAAPAPVLFESGEAFCHALTERNADAMPNTVHLEARKKKPSGGGSTNSTGAAMVITPSRVLQVGAVGLGVIEVWRLWV
ncbi:hypothetical protein ACN47E_003955 [Coniothyrium glycines]